MKLKRYVNGAWVVVDKELKQLTTATDSAASPISIIAPLAEPFDNYRVYGTSSGVGDETENLWDAQSASLTYMQVAGAGSIRWAFTITEPGTYTLKCFDDKRRYIYCRQYNTSTGSYGTYYHLSVPEGDTELAETVTLEVDSDIIILVYPRSTETADIVTTLFNLAKLCAVPGSTAPDHYIPPGYQIPLTETSGETENLFDYAARNVDKGFVAGARLMENGSLDTGTSSTNWCVSEYINIEGGKAYTWKWTTVETPVQNDASIAFYDASNAFLIGIAYRKRGIIPTTAPQNAAYIRVSFLATEGTTLRNCMLVKGSTAPDHYIPHRYTADYNLYIGSSKLYEDEYLDYQEQKVYKKSSNVWNGNVEKWNETNRIEVTDNGNGTFTLQKTYSTAGAFPAAKVGQVLEAGKKYEITFTISGMTSEMIATNPCICLRKTTNAIFKQTTITADGTYKLLTDAVPSNASYAFSLIPVYDNVSVTFSNVVVSDISIKEIVSTDPPVPFPFVQHYEGESTTSVDTTVAPDKLELTYQGWRVAANPEPKFYHNGQWMTEYRRVEYLKSTGTQAITTNIVPLSTTRTELDIKFGSDIKGSSASGYERGIFGAAEVDGSNNVKAQYIVNALKGSPNSLIFYNRFTWHSGISANYLNDPDNFDTADNAKQTVAMQGGIGSWGSTSIDFTSEMLDWPELTIPLVVFGAYNAAGGGLLPFKVKELSVYEMRTYDSNTLTHNLIPVERQIDGVLGLYDTITDTFYTNAGTGTFVKGGYI